jgi:hypothetical protein
MGPKCLFSRDGLPKQSTIIRRRLVVGQLRLTHLRHTLLRGVATCFYCVAGTNRDRFTRQIR